jgi:predicted transcriptional regulator
MALKKLPNGELENQIVDVLWDAGRPLTPGEVHELLRPHRDLAYTTITTILVRLWEKAILTRTRAGRAFVYEPVLTREERAAARMQELLGAAGDPSLALARFVESLPADQRDDLRRALRERKAR